MDDDLAHLEDALGFRFSDRSLLVEAVTHSSAANERPPTKHNGRLAFLGDAALSLLVAERYYEERQGADKAELTEARKALVSNAALAELAAHIGLSKHLRLGVGASQQGHASSPATLSTGMEAVLGAMYLDRRDPSAGMATVRALLRRKLGDRF